MDAEDVLDDVGRIASHRREVAIVDDEDGDRLPTVDGGGQVVLSEVAIEGAEVRVFVEDLGDVKGIGSVDQEEEREEEREGSTHRHVVFGSKRENDELMLNGEELVRVFMSSECLRCVNKAQV